MFKIISLILITIVFVGSGFCIYLEDEGIAEMKNKFVKSVYMVCFLISFALLLSVRW